MSLFTKQSNEEIHLVLDVGNGSVGGALVLFKEKSSPTILYSKRLPLSISDKIQSEALSIRVLAMLEEVLKNIAIEGLKQIQTLSISQKKVKHVFCILASPWYVSKTKILKIQSKDPVSVTKTFVDSLLKKEEELFQKALIERTDSTGATSRAVLETIEKKIVQVKLNGYHTLNPYQKKAKDVELAMYLSVAAEDMLRSIERLIGKFFYSHHTAFYSYALSEYRVIQNIFSQESDFIFMDISGEVTDVTSVERHILMETTSFPVGRNFIIKKIAEELTVLPDIALSAINIYTSGHTDAMSTEKIKNAYQKAILEWSSYFSHAISDIVKGQTPTKIFVTVDKDVETFFMESVKNILTQEKGYAPVHFTTTAPILLNEETLSHFVNFAPHVKRDPFLALESVFCNSLFHERN